MYKESFITSFQPIIGDNPTVLILGTMPGKESLRLQQYYGHTRNHFWKIIYSSFFVDVDVEYQQKVNFLKQNHIALWDVCFKAIRKTSLDSDILKESPNTINDLIKKHNTIKTIGFNGKKAAQLYDKYFTRIKGITYHTLLSTSPANARYTFEEKLANWKTILN